VSDTPDIDSVWIITEEADSLLFRIAVSGSCPVKTTESVGAIPGPVTATAT
jgi:hypothetical protein